MINKLNNNQKGVVHHLALLIMIGLVLAGVSFAGWRVWQSRDEASASGTINPARYTKNGDLLTGNTGFMGSKGFLKDYDFNKKTASTSFIYKGMDAQKAETEMNGFQDAASAPIFRYSNQNLIYLKRDSKKASIYEYSRKNKTSVKVFSVNSSDSLRFCTYGNGIAYMKDPSTDAKTIALYDFVSKKTTDISKSLKSKIADLYTFAQIACGNDSIALTALTATGGKLQANLYTYSVKTGDLETVSSNIDPNSVFCGKQYQSKNSIVLNSPDGAITNYSIKSSPQLLTRTKDLSWCMKSPDNKKLVLVQKDMTLFDVDKKSNVSTIHPNSKYPVPQVAHVVTEMEGWSPIAWSVKKN